MASLGISLIAFNEQDQILRALESAAFADQIVVVDCESTDRTYELVKSFPKVQVFRRPNNPNLNINKSFGINQLKTDWIFYLDPDERIPSALANEIKREIENTNHSAFKIARLNHFFGRPLYYGGQYPDKQIRLFKRGFARFPNKHVHEALEVEGSIGELKNYFEHFPYPNLSAFLRKMDFYTSFQANFWHEKGLRNSYYNFFRYLFFRPFFRFVRRFFLKQGFRDGWQGYIAAIGDAFQIVVSYGKFLELE